MKQLRLAFSGTFMLEVGQETLRISKCFSNFKIKVNKIKHKEGSEKNWDKN